MRLRLYFSTRQRLISSHFIHSHTRTHARPCTHTQLHQRNPQNRNWGAHSSSWFTLTGPSWAAERRGHAVVTFSGSSFFRAIMLIQIIWSAKPRTVQSHRSPTSTTLKCCCIQISHVFEVVKKMQRTFWNVFFSRLKDTMTSHPCQSIEIVYRQSWIIPRHWRH